MSRTDDAISMTVQDVFMEAETDGYCPLHITTDRGEVQGRYYQAANAACGVIFVGGAGGGWDTPACGLYPRLGKALAGKGIAALRVRFRDPHQLEEATLDVLAGLQFMQEQGIKAAALVGHSFGGAVVIQAAAAMEMVRAVIALATQSYGTAPVADLVPRCSLLLIHGTADKVLSPSCSEYVYEIAGEPKTLMLQEGANHGLDEVAADVYRDVEAWLLNQFAQWQD